MACIWDIESGEQTCSPLPHLGAVRSVAFSPNGELVVTGSSDQTARLWESTGEAVGSPLQHRRDVWAVAFSPDGQFVLTGSPEGTAQLWEIRTGQPLGPPLQDRGPVWAVAFSPNGEQFLTGSSNPTARFWNRTDQLRGSPERAICWTEVITGFELDGNGGIRMLDPEMWAVRRKLLDELGGPPVAQTKGENIEATSSTLKDQ